jgi:CheY-like chemotaxis protein
MSAEELGRIFEPFARGTTAGSAAPGAGLGLTIAKMLIDLMGGEMTVQSTPGAGSVFRVRLFLPHVHEAPVASVRRARAPRVRRGYEGRRRRVMVVDNEEADRELLVHVLAPLGFELRAAASGHDALDLIAAGWRPDAMFVDLAMPGIDGWETIRRSRALRLTNAAVAIVSANAFDKRLDNDVGIAPEDFFVKPVRHSELLDWLERRLELRWTDNAVATAPPLQPVAAATMPSPERLRALEEAVSLGYFRGIMNQLDDIDAAQPECAAWTAAQRALARRFQFEQMCAPSGTALPVFADAHEMRNSP